MKNDDMLIQLVEQAACCVNMLGPSDLSDAGQLDEILSRIESAVHELDREPGQLVTQLEGATADATQMLKQVLRQEVEDTSLALDTIAKAICSLQGLARKLSEPETCETAGATAAEVAPEGPTTGED